MLPGVELGAWKHLDLLKSSVRESFHLGGGPGRTFSLGKVRRRVRLGIGAQALGAATESVRWLDS